MPATTVLPPKVHLVTVEETQAGELVRSTRTVDCTMDDACPQCTPETRAQLARERADALRAQVQGWLDEQVRYAATDLADERARLSKAAASPDFDLSVIANMASRVAAATGAHDAHAAAANALRDLDPVTALYLVATNSLRPSGGVYGARTGSQQEAYAEAVGVASRTVLSALRVIVTAPTDPTP